MVELKTNWLQLQEQNLLHLTKIETMYPTTIPNNIGTSLKKPLANMDIIIIVATTTNAINNLCPKVPTSASTILP